MKINPDRKCEYVEPGSAHCASLLRVSRDPWLRLELQAQQERQRSAWSEAEHVKSVKTREREAEIRQRARERDLFWFPTKAKNWDAEQVRKCKAGTSSRAIRIGNTKGWMPRYAMPIRTAQGLLFPFQRTVYRNAKSSKQGAGKDLVRYGAEGAHEFENGALAFFSSVGLTIDEAAEAFDQLESVNRSAAGNAKVVHHMIIQSLAELPPEEQWAMLLRYCEQVFGSQDLPYSVCLHPPSEDGDQRNWHAHVVFSYRPMVRNGEAEWHIGRALRSDLDCPEQWTRMRFLLAEELNHTCEMHGVNKRYTHLSYAAAGMDYIPQVHLGAGLTEKVRRGEKVALNEQNHAVAARNSALQFMREVRSALNASVAVVSKYVRQERDAVRAAISVPRPDAIQPAKSIDIRGVTVPIAPELLAKVGRPKEDMIPANDTETVSERSSLLPAGATPPKLPDSLLTVDGAMGTGFGLGRYLPVKLPEPLSNVATEPAVVLHPAPLMPQPLDADAAVQPGWKLPSKTITVPAALAASEERDRFFEGLFGEAGKASPAIPDPMENMNHLFSARWQLPVYVPPSLPEPIEPVSEGSSDRAVLRRSLASNGSPQLPHPLPSEEQSPSEFNRTWDFEGPVLRIVEMPDTRFASDPGGIEATAPRLPEGVLNDPTKVRAAEDFSTLNSSGLVDQSGPRIKAAQSQFPAPPKPTPDGNESSPRAGNQRQNEQEEETERSPLGTDPVLERTHAQISMFELMRLLEQQRYLLVKDGDDRITVPNDVLRRAGIGTDRLTADDVQGGLAALHARNQNELEAIALHVAAFPDQFSNSEGYWAIDQNAMPVVRSAVESWRNNEKVKQAIERIVAMPIDPQGSASVKQRRNEFLTTAMGGPASPPRSERKMTLLMTCFKTVEN